MRACSLPREPTPSTQTRIFFSNRLVIVLVASGDCNMDYEWLTTSGSRTPTSVLHWLGIGPRGIRKFKAKIELGNWSAAFLAWDFRQGTTRSSGPATLV